MTAHGRDCQGFERFGLCKLGRGECLGPKAEKFSEAAIMVFHALRACLHAQ